MVGVMYGRSEEDKGREEKVTQSNQRRE